MFTSADELNDGFVYDDFCGANLSKYLLKETAKTEEKVLVFLKPCDTYSFNQLLTEHRIRPGKGLCRSASPATARPTPKS